MPKSLFPIMTVAARSVTSFLLSSPFRPTSLFIRNSTSILSAFCFSFASPVRPTAATFRFFSNSSSSTRYGWTPPLMVSTMESEFLRGGSAWKDDTRHWLVFMNMLGLELSTEEDLFNVYIKTLASVLGSEDDAKKRIYLVSSGHNYSFGFGAEFDSDARVKLGGHADVLYVTPDTGYGVRNKDQNVRPAVRFTPMNRYHRLDNIFSYHHLSERNSKWDYDHWLVNVKQPDCGFASNRQIIDFCVGLLAEVIGSKEAAYQKVYVIWLKLPFGFGVQIDMETSQKLRDCSEVLKVLPDYAFDVMDRRQGALHILPSTHGLRFSRPCSTEYDSSNWLNNKEEVIDDLGTDNKNLKEFGSTENDSGNLLNDKEEVIDDLGTADKSLKEFGSTEYDSVNSLNNKEEVIDDLGTADKNLKEFGSTEYDSGNSLNNKDEVTGDLGTADKKLKEYGDSYSLMTFIRNFNDAYQNEPSNCEHWFVIIKKPQGCFASVQQRIEFCIQTLGTAVGSEEEVRKKTYRIKCGSHFFGFGIEIDADIANKLSGAMGVVAVIPDYFINKLLEGLQAE